MLAIARDKSAQHINGAGYKTYKMQGCRGQLLKSLQEEQLCNCLSLTSCMFYKSTNVHVNLYDLYPMPIAARQSASKTNYLPSI